MDWKQHCTKRAARHKVAAQAIRKAASLPEMRDALTDFFAASDGDYSDSAGRLRDTGGVPTAPTPGNWNTLGTKAAMDRAIGDDLYQRLYSPKRIYNSNNFGEYFAKAMESREDEA
jgi:hypothetical protein